MEKICMVVCQRYATSHWGKFLANLAEPLTRLSRDLAQQGAARIYRGPSSNAEKGARIEEGPFVFAGKRYLYCTDTDSCAPATTREGRWRRHYIISRAPIPADGLPSLLLQLL
jgi:hypothetical protein